MRKAQRNGGLLRRTEQTIINLCFTQVNAAESTVLLNALFEASKKRSKEYRQILACTPTSDLSQDSSVSSKTSRSYTSTPDASDPLLITASTLADMKSYLVKCPVKTPISSGLKTEKLFKNLL